MSSEGPASEIAIIEPQETGAKPLIRSIEVNDLFGRYSYNIKVPRTRTPRLILLYGDNGSGKTTILRLLYYLLSPAGPKGSNVLAETPFRHLAILLSNGDIITTEKTQGLVGPYEIRVERKRQVICRQVYPDAALEGVPWHIVLNEREHFQLNEREHFQEIREVAGEVDVIFKTPAGHQDKYVQYLTDLNVSPYYLADDRRIYSHRLEDEGASRESRAQPGRGISRRQEAIQSLTRELSDALHRTNNWLRDQVLSGLGEGTQGNDATYLDVAKRLAAQHAPSDEPSVSEFEQRMVNLAERTLQFSQFGLVPEFRADLYIAELNRMDHDRLVVAEDVLTPYVDGQQARLDSLQEAHQLIRTFIDTVNGFLTNKALYYRFPQGLSIVATDGETERLGPSKLSSGERQLLLLLCNSLLSREESLLFIIDEPEISLNVKWQRKLIPALLACVGSSSVQFVLATHSVELITGHREFLAQLRDIEREKIDDA